MKARKLSLIALSALAAIAIGGGSEPSDKNQPLDQTEKKQAIERRNAKDLETVLRTLPEENRTNGFDSGRIEEFVGFISAPFSWCAYCRVNYPKFEWLARDSRLYDAGTTGFGLIKETMYQKFVEGLYDENKTSGFPKIFYFKKDKEGKWETRGFDTKTDEPCYTHEAIYQKIREEEKSPECEYKQES